MHIITIWSTNFRGFDGPNVATFKLGTQFWDNVWFNQTNVYQYSLYRVLLVPLSALLSLFYLCLEPHVVSL